MRLFSILCDCNLCNQHMCAIKHVADDYDKAKYFSQQICSHMKYVFNLE